MLREGFLSPQGSLRSRESAVMRGLASRDSDDPVSPLRTQFACCGLMRRAQETVGSRNGGALKRSFSRQGMRLRRNEREGFFPESTRLMTGRGPGCRRKHASRKGLAPDRRTAGAGDPWGCGNFNLVQRIGAAEHAGFSDILNRTHEVNRALLRKEKRRSASSAAWRVSSGSLTSESRVSGRSACDGHGDGRRGVGKQCKPLIAELAAELCRTPPRPVT